jgi:NAD+ kinase
MSLGPVNHCLPACDQPRVLILANRQKEGVAEALDQLRPWLAERATFVEEIETTELTAAQAEALSPADLALVLGGDGTFLSQARLMIDTGVPLLGINFGKLGFLAEYTIEALKRHWDCITGGDCRMSPRMMLDVAVFDSGAPVWGGQGEMPEPGFATGAMNDVVVTAGPPFRMIELELAIEPTVAQTSATSFSGDGVIVATPTGSTAYNLAAGGPIVSPGIDGVCVSPLCPQSLAFRPIVYSAHCETWLRVHRANEGTTLVIDGQRSAKLVAGQQVRITKHANDVLLVHNPDWNYWSMLAHKMHWAAHPRRA